MFSIIIGQTPHMSTNVKVQIPELKALKKIPSCDQTPTQFRDVQKYLPCRQPWANTFIARVYGSKSPHIYDRWRTISPRTCWNRWGFWAVFFQVGDSSTLPATIQEKVTPTRCWECLGVLQTIYRSSADLKSCSILQICLSIVVSWVMLVFDWCSCVNKVVQYCVVQQSHTWLKNKRLLPSAERRGIISVKVFHWI